MESVGNGDTVTRRDIISYYRSVVRFMWDKITIHNNNTIIMIIIVKI